MGSIRCLLFVAVISLLVFIGACAAPAPPEAASEEDPVTTIVVPDIPTPTPPAPCTSIIDVDLDAAYENPSYAEGDVFWAFLLNFQVRDGDDNPVGCVRFYGRDRTQKTFVAIDGGGIPVETCRLNLDQGTPADLYSVDAVPHTSLGAMVQGEVFPTGVLDFQGQSHVACDFDLKAWAATLDDNDVSGFEKEDETAVLEALEDLQMEKYQVYETFAIVAAGAVTTDTGQVPNPVVFYQPLTDDACCSPVAMALPATSREGLGTIQAQLEQETYTLSPDEESACWYESTSENYWWTDLDTSQAVNRGGHTLTFIRRGMGMNSLERCTDVLPHTNGEPAKLNFWTGPAMLYIGCHPDGGGGCLSRLQGQLFSIVVDPTDSKPQEQ